MEGLSEGFPWRTPEAGWEWSVFCEILRLFDGLSWAEDIPELAVAAIRQSLGNIFSIRITAASTDDTRSRAGPVYLFLTVDDVLDRCSLVLWNVLLGLVASGRVSPYEKSGIYCALSASCPDALEKATACLEDLVPDYPSRMTIHDLAPQPKPAPVFGSVPAGCKPAEMAAETADVTEEAASIHDDKTQAQSWGDDGIDDGPWHEAAVSPKMVAETAGVMEEAARIHDDETQAQSWDDDGIDGPWPEAAVSPKKARKAWYAWLAIPAFIAIVVIGVAIVVIGVFLLRDAAPVKQQQDMVPIYQGDPPSAAKAIDLPLMIPGHPVLHCRTGMPCAWAANGHIEAMAVSSGIKQHWRVLDVRGKGLLLVPFLQSGPADGISPADGKPMIAVNPSPISRSAGEIVMMISPPLDAGSMFWGVSRAWRVVRLTVY